MEAEGALVNEPRAPPCLHVPGLPLKPRSSGQQAGRAGTSWLAGRLPKRVVRMRCSDAPQVTRAEVLRLIDLRCISRAWRPALPGPGVISATGWKEGNYS